ncbi:MAG: nucleotide exchange factor GrpE [Parvibaculales bacterium]
MTKENEKSADAAEAASASEPNNPETQNPAADAPTDSGSEPVNEASVDEVPVDEAPAEPTAEEQIAALNDQLLRTLAELENTRRRAERDRGDALKFGAMSFARDMLSVADNMQRALKAAADLGADDLPDAAKAMLEGVEATERDLQASLQRHKVMPINPMGEKFDPNQHEAMFEAPGTGQAAGTIIEVIEIGYVMAERLLRPAKVGIAKD